MTVNHGVPYVQGMMTSTVGLLLLNIKEQEVLQIIVRLYIDLNYSRFFRDSLDYLSLLSREAIQIVVKRNGLEYEHFFSDPEIFAASQMLGFKLCVTLFADYVGLQEVDPNDQSTPAFCVCSCFMVTKHWWQV